VRRNAVVVADNDAARRAKTVEWLTACGIDACPQPDGEPGKALLELIREVQPRIVMCRPGPTGMALFHPLRHMKSPPMIVVVSDAKASKDEVHYEDRLIVASIRTPPQMAALCKFIAAALTITSRLDDPEDFLAPELLVHPAVERFIDPALRPNRLRPTPVR
jgi:hypothetical protein